MSDEEKTDPMWKANELPANQETIITLDSGKEIASGQSKYGEWRLWVVQVENATVFEKGTNKKIEGYTGKAICFPSEKLHEQFLQHTNGTKENTKIGVTKLFKENSQKKPYTSFESKLIEGGQTPPSNLSDHHYQFIEGFKTLVERNIMDDTIVDFTHSANTDTWGITDETIVTKLWTVYQEGK